MIFKKLKSRARTVRVICRTSIKKNYRAIREVTDAGSNPARAIQI